MSLIHQSSPYTNTRDTVEHSWLCIWKKCLPDIWQNLSENLWPGRVMYFNWLLVVMDWWQKDQMLVFVKVLTYCYMYWTITRQNKWTIPWVICSTHVIFRVDTLAEHHEMQPHCDCDLCHSAVNIWIGTLCKGKKVPSSHNRLIATSSMGHSRQQRST